jgi:hypothetical protein
LLVIIRSAKGDSAFNCDVSIELDDMSRALVLIRRMAYAMTLLRDAALSRVMLVSRLHSLVSLSLTASLHLIRHCADHVVCAVVQLALN